MNSATAPAGRLFVCMIGQLDMNIENVTACSQRRRPDIPLLITPRGRILHAGSGDRMSPYITHSSGGTAFVHGQSSGGCSTPLVLRSLSAGCCTRLSLLRPGPCHLPTCCYLPPASHIPWVRVVGMNPTLAYSPVSISLFVKARATTPRTKW